MEKYKTLYKCRLCGARFYGPTSTTDRDTAVSYMVHQVAGIRGVYPDQPAQLHMHECTNGSLGVAEFLGMAKVTPGSYEWDEKTESGLLEED